MLRAAEQSRITDANAEYYGVSMEKLMENAGKGLAWELIKRYGRGRRIAFVCGPGNNGGDGMAAARHLARQAEPVVYLVGSADKIKSKLTQKNWQKLKSDKYDNIQPKDITGGFDVVVECLFGTGISGDLREPYRGIVKKINRMRAGKVSVDMPAPGFKSELSICLETEKVPGSPVVDIGIPAKIKDLVGPGEVKALKRPGSGSHKGDNGKVLIIGGNETYHGALFLSAKMASRLVDLVYVSSVPENNQLIRGMKSKLAEFIAVPRPNVASLAKEADVVLAGPGLGTNEPERKLLLELTKETAGKRFVLDADALKLIKPSQLPPGCIITPHASEFKALFNQTSCLKNIKSMSLKYGCVIAVKGKTDYVAYQGEVKRNTAGNAGMTKGGTGDVLAGLIAGLACGNDPYLAARAGVFLNGLAGDKLEKRKSYMYSASELINEVPKVYKHITRST